MRFHLVLPPSLEKDPLCHLQLAIRRNDFRSLDRLLNTIGYPEDPVGPVEIYDHDRFTLGRRQSLIELAINYADNKILERLCKAATETGYGINIMGPLVDGAIKPSLLEQAVMKEDTRKLQTLLNHGADRGRLGEAFFRAIIEGSGKMINFFVKELKVNPNELVPPFNMLPIHIAVVSQQLESVRSLMELRARPRAISLDVIAANQDFVFYGRPRDCMESLQHIKALDGTNLMKVSFNEETSKLEIPAELEDALISIRDLMELNDAARAYERKEKYQTKLIPYKEISKKDGNLRDVAEIYVLLKCAFPKERAFYPA